MIDILKFKLQNINKKNQIILGNLPYNISSQILIKILKIKNIDKKIYRCNINVSKRAS